MITEANITEFLTGKLGVLASRIPGYSTVSIEAESPLDGQTSPKIEIRAYNEHVGHAQSATLDGAVALLIQRNGGRTEADMLRAQAAELVAKADRLEGKEVA